MFKFLASALVGGVAFAKDPVSTGVLYLKDGLKKAGQNPDRLPLALYQELAKYALDTADSLAMLDKREKKVTHFTNHLEGVLYCLLDAIGGRYKPIPGIQSPIDDIFRRYKVIL
ncbi:hypothetical protein [Ferrovibrio sp.]|uniref:hypothetical protein n=1 Tax=Ferrovibrio sp. TaxID=1917215 RepID=UPI00261151AC|nr:hypothetical protein [Ferrovibrio sp.]